MAIIDWNIFNGSLVFAFLMTATPGLNNILSLLFVLHHGVKKAIIFRLGVIVWFPVMGLVGVIALRPMIDLYAGLDDVFNIFGSLLLLYVGIKIFMSVPDIKSASKLKYVGFWGAGVLQLINGKAWTMVIGMASVYTVDGVNIFIQAFSIALALLVANFVCAVPWIVAPTILRERLIQPKRLRIINLSLGGLVVIMAVKPLLGYVI